MIKVDSGSFPVLGRILYADRKLIKKPRNPEGYLKALHDLKNILKSGDIHCPMGEGLLNKEQLLDNIALSNYHYSYHMSEKQNEAEWHEEALLVIASIYFFISYLTDATPPKSIFSKSKASGYRDDLARKLKSLEKKITEVSSVVSNHSRWFSSTSQEAITDLQSAFLRLRASTRTKKSQHDLNTKLAKQLKGSLKRMFGIKKTNDLIRKIIELLEIEKIKTRSAKELLKL